MALRAKLRPRFLKQSNSWSYLVEFSYPIHLKLHFEVQQLVENLAALVEKIRSFKKYKTSKLTWMQIL